MPKVKADEFSFDIDEMEGAEYTETEFETYDGPLPPKDTVLVAYLKSMWLTETANGDDMIKAIVVADGNEGDLEKYNGLPMWENLALIPTAKFKWKPFIDQFGITIRDIKTKMIVSAEAHPMFGNPVEKIGTFKPSSDESWCRVVTKIGHNQDGDPRAEIRKWLDYEDLAEEEEEPEEEVEEEETEEEAEEEPEDEEEDEEEDDDDEEEEEEEPAPVKRGRGRAAAPARRTAAKPAAAKAAATGRKSAAPAATRTAGRKPARATSASTKAAPARRGRRASAADDNEPPF